MQRVTQICCDSGNAAYFWMRPIRRGAQPRTRSRRETSELKQSRFQQSISVAKNIIAGVFFNRVLSFECIIICSTNRLLTSLVGLVVKAARYGSQKEA